MLAGHVQAAGTRQDRVHSITAEHTRPAYDTHTPLLYATVLSMQQQSMSTLSIDAKQLHLLCVTLSPILQHAETDHASFTFLLADSSSEQLLGTASLIIERKFIHSCGKVSVRSQKQRM